MDKLTITINGLNVEIRVPYVELYRAKSVPNAKWDKKNKIWTAPLIRATARAVLSEFSVTEEISLRDAKLLIGIRDHVPENQPFPPHKFKNQPRKHQWRALNKCYGKNMFAFFMRMRTGKTFTSLMWAERLYLEGQIDSILVICPTSVKSVWLEEVAEHMTVGTEVFVMEAGKNTSATWFNAQPHPDNIMKIAIYGTESMSQGVAHEFALEFTKKHNAMIIQDESHFIKNSRSARTDRITAIGEHCAYKALLTGTPIAQGIEDLYAQYNFLSPAIIGMRSFFNFRNRYCIMGGFEGRQIVGYDNTRELMQILAPYSIVVETKEAFPNLPDRIEKKLIVDPTKEQVAAMKSLKVEMLAKDGDEVLEIETALERMIRFQQIAGGHFPYKTKDRYEVKRISGKNPKMDAMMDLVEGDANTQKYIIWANFVPEIQLIAETLAKKYGHHSTVTFYGSTTGEERTIARTRFQKDPDCRFFISNQATGGMGIKLSAADIMIYYSNSFKYVDREQSGDRWIDHERVHNVLVVDLILNHEIDKTIHKALATKQDVATYVSREIQK